MTRNYSRGLFRSVKLALLIACAVSIYPLASASGSVPVGSPAAASVETIQFHSQLVNATLPYNVILPPGYRASTVARYPVLYLLHGFGGHYTDWVTKTNVDRKSVV